MTNEKNIYNPLAPFFKGEFGELEKWSAGVLGCLAQIFRF